jgi:hypothetical protein
MNEANQGSETNRYFINKKAEMGFETFKRDMVRLREANKKFISLRALKWLNHISDLTRIVITAIIGVSAIIATYTIINTRGIDVLTQMVSWITDILKLAKLFF